MHDNADLVRERSSQRREQLFVDKAFGPMSGLGRRLHRRDRHAAAIGDESLVEDAEPAGSLLGGAGRPSAGPAWTDSHCHVQSADDSSALLGRAAAAGVQRVVVVGTDEATSRAGVAMSAELSGVGAPPVEIWSTVGLHPHDASEGVEAVSSYLAELASSGLSRGRVVAVGECGLDYHYDYSPRDDQRNVFATQIGLAHQHSMALVIHTREAWDDTFAILDREGLPPRVVFHCFTGGVEEAKECLDRGAYLSFSGIVTFPSATELREAARMCPLRSIMVETDSPFLTPVPHRGKPNEPAFVPLVGRAIAQLKSIDVAEVAQATSANAAVVFNLHG